MILNDVDRWLLNHPAWIKRKDLEEILTSKDKVADIVRSHEYGFLTGEGEFFKRLVDVPTFVGIVQVVKANSLLVSRRSKDADCIITIQAG